MSLISVDVSGIGSQPEVDTSSSQSLLESQQAVAEWTAMYQTASSAIESEEEAAKTAAKNLGQ
ncbi:uncharacterized protein Dvar_72380 [Desulfosarcina variabilis str. Montpellier]|uniref:hypothetical protein n=1 Tax=Desulfosarcina variabilis TaxID=2300 RepID=UPI003AFB10E3